MNGNTTFHWFLVQFFGTTNTECRRFGIVEWMKHAHEIRSHAILQMSSVHLHSVFLGHSIHITRSRILSALRSHAIWLLIKKIWLFKRLHGGNKYSKLWHMLFYSQFELFSANALGERKRESSYWKHFGCKPFAFIPFCLACLPPSKSRADGFTHPHHTHTHTVHVPDTIGIAIDESPPAAILLLLSYHSAIIVTINAPVLRKEPEIAEGVSWWQHV